ncbi:isocitrate lyase/PEP mutase family protein [Futiania mangrovi]|uniref:Isocitrate lyase/PEP mutase family protein n=1 Tax=Futiania mangrovi TaxID=2959716 RepID=A0A9J6PCD8_9PROT|nr:isocitrate lyase/PEP mutase family protein [Futiania mangrovii]MCP1336973.1 isocitrate lyase/PEP mutase family protein [Futiania mangrovii]
METPAARLRTLLEEPVLRLMPCCFDPLSARLIREAGFPLSLMSGFAVSGSRLAMPDTGLISFAEMVDQLGAICDAEPDLLVIGDGDTGFGNAMNAQRTVRAYAKAGAAAVMIEDQVSPKKCGHTKGKQVVSRKEARMKVRAAVDAARTGPHDILVMARTDARAPLGFEEALARCHDFVEEGADIIFLEAPENAEEMRAFTAAIDRPCMANMVRGGKTPVPAPAELQAMGFRIAAYPLTLLTASIAAQRAALKAIADGDDATVPQVDFETLKTLVGFDDYYAGEERYRAD